MEDTDNSNPENQQAISQATSLLIELLSNVNVLFYIKRINEHKFLKAIFSTA